VPFVRDLLPLDDLDAGLGGQVVEVEELARLVLDDDLRVLLAGVLDDDELIGAALLGGLLAHGLADLDVLELHDAGLLGEDGDAVGVPLDEHLALANLGAGGDLEGGAVGDLVLLQLASLVVEAGDVAVALEDGQDASAVGGLVFGM
jgi:hypothetical protein